MMCMIYTSYYRFDDFNGEDERKKDGSSKKVTGDGQEKGRGTEYILRYTIIPYLTNGLSNP